MRSLFFLLLLAASVGAGAQTPTPSGSQGSANPPAAKPPADASAPQANKPGQPVEPSLTAPRSDRVDASALDQEPGESSSKDDQIDLSPPPDDARAHPRSAEALTNAEESESSAEVNEFHPWDPHKAAKDVEVGDFYFKQKNYIAAESRYREALFYKDNDAVATFRLAVCLEKMDRPDEALEQYQSYLQILPHGPEAEAAKKAIERLKTTPSAK